MSYESALKAAGATIHAVEYFGTYQGRLVAHVTVDGIEGFISIDYGSCAGCDTYEAFTIGFDWDKGPDEAALAKFGENLIENFETREQMLASLEEDREWDSDAVLAIKWVKEQKK